MKLKQLSSVILWTTHQPFRIESYLRLPDATWPDESTGHIAIVSAETRGMLYKPKTLKAKKS